MLGRNFSESYLRAKQQRIEQDQWADQREMRQAQLASTMLDQDLKRAQIDEINRRKGEILRNREAMQEGYSLEEGWRQIGDWSDPVIGEEYSNFLSRNPELGDTPWAKSIQERIDKANDNRMTAERYRLDRESRERIAGNRQEGALTDVQKEELKDNERKLLNGEINESEYYANRNRIIGGVAPQGQAASAGTIKATRNPDGTWSYDVPQSETPQPKPPTQPPQPVNNTPKPTQPTAPWISPLTKEILKEAGRYYATGSLASSPFSGVLKRVPIPSKETRETISGAKSFLDWINKKRQKKDEE